MTPADSQTDTSESYHGPMGKLLIEAGLVNQEQLDQALAVQRKQGGKTFEILVELEIVDEAALHEFLSRQPGVASIDLANYELDERLKELVPQALAEKNLLLPIDKMGRNLTVAMACPLDLDSIAKIEAHSGLRVKAMLCRLSDMRAAVKKYYRIGESQEAAVFGADWTKVTGTGPNKKAITTALEKLESLPILQASTEKLSQWGGDTSVSFRQFVDTILGDPPFAASVLGAANSSAFGLSQQVFAVPLAATLVGRDGLAFMLPALTNRNGKDGKDPLDYESLRARAIFTGMAAKTLANVTGRGKPDPAFSAGLLHELGRIALAAVKADKYAKIDKNLTGEELQEAEIKSFGLAHPEAGFLVLKAWHVPDAVAIPVRHYAKPEDADDAYQDAAWLVNLASTLSLAAATDAPLTKEQALERGQRSMKALGVSPEQAGKVIAQTTVAAFSLL